MEEEIDTSTLAKGTTWTFIAQAVLKLFGFIYLVVLAKLFSAEEIGIFYFVLSIINFITIFTDLGFSQSLPRYVPYLYGKGKIGALRSLLKTTFLTGGFLSLMFSIALFFSVPTIASALGRPEALPAFQALAFLPIVSELASLAGGFLLGRKRIREYQIVNATQGIVKLLFTVALGFLLAFTATSLSLAYLLSFVPLAFGYGYFALKDLRTLASEKEEISKDLLLEVFYFGILLTIINTFYVVAASTDRFMLGFLLKEDALSSVGIYSVVTTFAGLLLLPSSAVITIFFPMVSELFGKNKIEEIRKITGIAIKWSVIITAPFFILLAGFSSFFIRTFYGEDYLSGNNVFLLYTLSYAFFLFSLLPMKSIAAMRRLDVELKIAAASAVLNVVLNFFFIQWWGMDGAAFATAFSFLLMTILAFYYSKKLFNFSFPTSCFAPTFAAFVAFLIVFFSKQPLLDLLSSLPLDALAIDPSYGDVAAKLSKLIVFGLLFVFSTLVYFFFLIATRSFANEEIVITQKAMRRLKIPEKYVQLFTRILSPQDPSH